MADTPKSDRGLPPPKKGQTYRCSTCGMELKITRDCGCQEPDHVHFHCCGKELVRLNDSQD